MLTSKDLKTPLGDVSFYEIYKYSKIEFIYIILKIMRNSIEKLLIRSMLKKIIICYCRECVEAKYGKVTVPIAPKFFFPREEKVVTCPCDACLFSYNKNVIQIITFESITVCIQPIRCYECMEYKILCLSSELNSIKSNNKPYVSLARLELEDAIQRPLDNFNMPQNPEISSRNVP